jgi:chloramphenicol O-acetyltransferase type A
MKTIDLSQWKRREHFEFFYRADYPQYNICANIDITRFLAYVKENNLSFYYAMIYAVTDVANQCENFKYRIREGKTIVLHDKLIPSYTDIEPNSTDDLFKLITLDLEDNIFDFVCKAREAVVNQKEYFAFERFVGHDEFLFITCIPWISFTHLSHTISLNRNDAVPRISWGKYFKEGEKTLLPFSVQVHHAFVDGVHVGNYFEKLQKYLDEF